LPLVMDRIKKVKNYRTQSKSKPTQKLSQTPMNYHVEVFPESNYLIIPEVSSERRVYMPIGWGSPDLLCSNKLRLLADADLFDFGILSSIMHMAWMRTVTGRMKSDYSYSVSIVYNNFPWPKEPSENQTQKVKYSAQKVLDNRANYPDSSLADLHDPLTMPSDLLKAHQALDKSVDQCYRKKPFANERERIEFLFELYEEYTAPLFEKNSK